MNHQELIQILSEALASGTGTPSGVSYYKTRCPRKARLSREAKQARLVAIEHNSKVFATGEGELVTVPDDWDGSFASRVGTVYHKLEDLYFTGQLEDIALEIDDQADLDKDPIAEAQRVFNVYRRLFSKDEFTIVCSEEYLPKTDKEKSLIEAEVGVSPYTLQVDRVVQASETQALVAREKRGLDLFAGGFYLYDTKTHDKKPSDVVLKYELEIQFPTYMMAWNAARPKYKVLGCIVNDVVRNVNLEAKEADGRLKCFRSYLIDYPTEHQQKVVRQYLARKKKYLETGEVNLDACTDWGICSFYKNGLCDRL